MHKHEFVSQNTQQASLVGPSDFGIIKRCKKKLEIFQIMKNFANVLAASFALYFCISHFVVPQQKTEASTFFNVMASAGLYSLIYINNSQSQLIIFVQWTQLSEY